ncbi:hypothetical protein CPB84DRAFT_1967089 [Gymnopilus junonius]|uniref:Uncharacterized protein n=1 Tax=Gymnopilus junonius TaxID=109634 RepID=A0A9P5N9L9_GYMJU|nr:hypothetical protein CPB84DRAFT_1967089 [Gymnopilus junonius]
MLGSYKPTYDRKFSEERLIDDFSQRIRGLTELLTSPASDLSLIVQELIIALGLVYFLSPDLKRLLSVIESRASNLKTLHLERVPWNTVPLDISRSLIDLARIPSLVNLELEWMENTPEDLVRRSGTLRSLRLFKVEFAPPDAFAGSSMSLLRLGRYLPNTAKYGFVESDRTLRGTGIADMESIQMTLLLADAAKYYRLMRAVSKSLAYLDISFIKEMVDPNLGSVIPLDALPSLRKIAIRFLTPTSSILEEIDIVIALQQILSREALAKFSPQPLEDEKELGSLGRAFPRNKHPFLRTATVLFTTYVSDYLYGNHDLDHQMPIGDLGSPPEADSLDVVYPNIVFIESCTVVYISHPFAYELTRPNVNKMNEQTSMFGIDVDSAIALEPIRRKQGPFGRRSLAVHTISGSSWLSHFPLLEIVLCLSFTANFTACITSNDSRNDPYSSSRPSWIQDRVLRALTAPSRARSKQDSNYGENDVFTVGSIGLDGMDTD